MTAKIRKQIYIEPNQETLLKKLSDETGISEAEFIRRAIDHLLRLFQRSRHDLAAWDQEKAFISDLLERGPVARQRTWQREELHEW